MNKYIFASLFNLLLILSPIFLLAQNPGGVTTGNTMWLKANNGIALTGSNVTQWNEVSGAGITGNFTTQNTMTGSPVQFQPTFLANGVNFNPYVQFVSTVPNSVSSGNAFSGLNLLKNDSNTIFQVIRLYTMTGTGVWLKWEPSITAPARLGFEVNNGAPNTGRLRFDLKGVNNRSTSVITDRHTLATAYTTATQSTVRINGVNESTINAPTAFNPGTSTARLILGNNWWSDAYPTTIDIAEVIIFRRGLTDAEKNRVESYLAVKYGMTTDQTVTTPYINHYHSANGTRIWDRDANYAYRFNITGIGRDDASALYQKQSKSINPNTFVTIYNGFTSGVFPAVNDDNTSIFAADNSFLLFGDNNLDTAMNTCFSKNNVAVKRMDSRVWKVKETGSVGTVTIAANVADLPDNVASILVSNDPTFPSATTTIYNLFNTGVVKYGEIDFTDGQYFTYASTPISLTITSNSPICEFETLTVAASGGPAGGTYSWHLPNGTNQVGPVITIPNANTTYSGTYTVSYSHPECNIPAQSAVITVHPSPAAPVVPPVVEVCQNDASPTINIVGSNIKWYDLVDNLLPSQPTINTSTPQTIYYKVSQTINGCESERVLVTIVIHPLPNVVVSPATITTCDNVPVTLNALGGTNTYLWSPDNTLNTNRGNIVVASPRQSTTYTVTATNEFNCRSTATATVSVNPTYNINLNVDICDGELYNLGGTNYGESGKYQHMFTSVDGCDSLVIVNLNVIPLPDATFFLKKDPCIDEIVDVRATVQNDHYTYTWEFDNGLITSGTKGQYKVYWDIAGFKEVKLVIFDGFCYSAVETQVINVHELPKAEIISPDNYEICIGDTVTFMAYRDESYYYNWYPGTMFGSFNHFSKADGVIREKEPVTVEVTDPYGCRSKASVNIDAQNCCIVRFANAFTPNGDGVNDLFRPIGAGIEKHTMFRIANRWGRIVYDAAGDFRGWDGTYNGEEQDAGVYYYISKYNCGTKEEVQKGEVILIR